MFARLGGQMFLGWAVALLFGLVSLGAAQTLMEQNTAMNMQDTLTGGGVGYTPSQYMNVPRPTGGMPTGMVGGPPPGMGPGMPPGMFAGMDQGPAPAAPAPPPIKKILVLTGERVTCHRTRTLLEDIHYEYRPEAEKGEYSDDGTHGDLQPNDNIYTNYTERDDVISPEANRIKLLYLRMFELCEQMNPIEFFGIPVATSESLSALPRMTDEENDRDERFLRKWHLGSNPTGSTSSILFLAPYRTDPEDPRSDFYPIFVPTAPRSPETPAPPNEQYNANAFAMDDFIQKTVDSLITPAVQPVNAPTGGRSSSRRSSSQGAQESGYQGDRWGQLRSDARRYGDAYGAQSSRYFRE